MLYHPASHLSTLREHESEESKCEGSENEESENEESKSEEGDESELEPLAKRTYSTRSRRHTSSFMLYFCINILLK